MSATLSLIDSPAGEVLTLARALAAIGHPTVRVGARLGFPNLAPSEEAGAIIARPNGHLRTPALDPRCCLTTKAAPKSASAYADPSLTRPSPARGKPGSATLPACGPHADDHGLVRGMALPHADTRAILKECLIDSLQRKGRLVSSENLDSIVADVLDYYKMSRPRSSALHNSGLRVIPGATTRSVVDFRPFPFRVARADGARFVDVDGHELIDFCGDYTAGLLGHNPYVVRKAIDEALGKGWAFGTAHSSEIELAELICERFPSIEAVRFTSSGTEANLLAIGTALHHVRGSKVLAFEGGYHGAVLSFNTAIAGSALNVPYDFVLAQYNDVQSVRAAFEAHAISCAIVEPMLGSGGCIPGSREFLVTLRRECDRANCVLIFDEVMTSRLYPGGLQRSVNVVPDMTTLGKYLAGGMTFGAFGGSANLMAHFDVRGGGSLTHSGTFNNNVFSMAAAIAVLRNGLDDQALQDNNRKGDSLRIKVTDALAASGLPLWVTGLGSMMHIHSTDERWITWLFHSMLNRGIYISPRGFVALSLPISKRDCDRMADALREWSGMASDLFRRVGASFTAG